MSQGKYLGLYEGECKIYGHRQRTVLKWDTNHVTYAGVMSFLNMGQDKTRSIRYYLRSSINPGPHTHLQLSALRNICISHPNKRDSVPFRVAPVSWKSLPRNLRLHDGKAIFMRIPTSTLFPIKVAKVKRK